MVHFHLMFKLTADSLSFQGASVNVTGLSWPPFFIEYERTSGGTNVKEYKGPDGLLFTTVANKLNFTFSFLPVIDWAEVRDRT